MKTNIILLSVILLAFGIIYTTNAENVQKNLLKTDSYFNSQTKKLCPDVEAIFPCSCFFDTFNNGVVMNCDNVTTELELQTIFTKPFPQNDMLRFYMDQKNINSSIDQLSLGVFGSKTFRNIELNHINFNFSFNSFAHMNATLHSFDVNSAPIYQVNYNFNSYAVLTEISLRNCPSLTDFLISSTTLEVLKLRHINITERADNKPYLLGSMPNLRKLDVVYGNLHKMPDTSGYPKLEYISLFGNQISSIDVSLRTENYLDVFNAAYNDFQDIPVDSIRMSENSKFYMFNNQIQSIDEEKWRNIFLNTSYIQLTGNPLNCSCVMAWLFGKDNSGTVLMEKLNGYERCKNDGVFLKDLDPVAYDIC